MSGPQISFRPYIELGAAYDNGFATLAVNDQGQLINHSSMGGSLTWGISGSHRWRHTTLGLDYHGGAQHYFTQSGYDSLDQSLLLGITHQFSRHMSGTIRQTAGIVSRDFGPLGLRETVPFDPATTAVPATDYFDNRTLYFTSQADLTYQKTARLSFDFGGDAFFVRRRSHSLYGTNGISARGDVQYRVSRRSTIGAQYFYSHYGYPGLEGGTDANGATFTYATRLSRRLEFSGYAGVIRVESKFIQSAAVDPVIAALLGISGTTQIVHQIYSMPNLAARLSRTFGQGVAYISGGHSISPGNGLFLTSTLTTVLAGYGYTGLRRWSFAASAGYTQADAKGTIAGSYNGVNEGVQLSRQLMPNVHFVASYVARQHTSPQYANYSRNMSEARIGIGYSPGEVPLRVW